MPIQSSSEIEVERHWVRWLMQTARTWEDIRAVVKPTAIEVLDDDHQKLTQLTLEINSLLDSSRGGQFSLESIEKQRHVLESMYAYAELHFHREEDLIEKLGLANIEQQRTQHEQFLGMLRTAMDDFNQGRLTVSLHLKQWILEWWVKHINGLDHETFGQENLLEHVLTRPDTWAHLVTLIKPTGVSSVDDEHCRMIGLASEWVKTLQAGGDAAPLLKELEDYVSQHFSNEEELIEAHGLPGLEAQKAQHAHFLEALHALELTRSTQPVDAVRLILNWWVSHINETDAISFSVDHLGKRILQDDVSWEDLEKFVVATGIAEIDAEHREMAAHMLKLDASSSAEEALKMIDQMIEYARHHFANEEGLLSRIGSPLLRAHADNHLKFLDMSMGFREDLMHGRLQLSRGLKGYLLEWWLRHIREYDVPALAVAMRESAP